MSINLYTVHSNLGIIYDTINSNCTHYKPILTGQNLRTESLSDWDVKYNNRHYAELTALLKISRINELQSKVGMLHYRRLLTTQKYNNNIKLLLKSVINIRKHEYIYHNEVVQNSLSEYTSLIKDSSIIHIADKYDIISPQPIILKKTVKNQLLKHLNKNYINRLINIIEKENKGYYKVLLKTLSSNMIIPFNIIITYNYLIRDYLEIILSVFERIKLLDNEGTKIYAYLSERMLSAYIIYLKSQGYSHKTLPIIKYILRE